MHMHNSRSGREVKMVNIDRIKGLAKAKGISVTYLCTAVGQGPYYLNDVKNKLNGKMPEERQQIISKILGTTVEYLRGETDDPEIKKDSVDSWNGVRMNAERKKIMDVIASLSDEDAERVARVLEVILKSPEDK